MRKEVWSNVRVENSKIIYYLAFGQMVENNGVFEFE